MRKIYSIMLALLATLCVGKLSAQTTADSISFTLEVDHAAAVEVIHTDYVSYDTIKVVDGTNLLKLGRGDYGFGMLYVNAKEGFGIASIESDGDPDDYSLPYFQSENASQWMMYPNAGAEGLTYTVVTFDYSSIRTDSILVWVDQSSKVLFQYYNGGKITLKDSTWQVVYYSPKEDVQDFPFFLNSASYDVPLYRVLHNGNKLELTEGFRGQYYYDLSVLESGDSLQILANAPVDVTFPIIFKFNADSIRSEVDSVQVNGVTVSLKDTIDVQWGKIVEMWFDATNNEVSVNENVLSQYNNSFEQVITDTTIWNIEIIPFKDFDVKLIAHNVTCFYVQNSATYGTNYELVEGENTITMNTGTSQIYIEKNKGCLIDSVLVDGVNTSTYSRIKCTENMTIEVFADSIKRDSVVMLYVDDANNYSSIRFSNANYEDMITSPIPSGYTQVKFAAIDNDFSISAYLKNPTGAYPAPKAVYYLNDSIFETAYSYTTYCYPTFANGDVFKIFADTAEVYTVSFALAEGAEISDVKKDHITAIDATKEYSVLENTEITFKTAATVTVDGKQLMAYKGVYTVPVVANTVITLGEPLSIANTVETPYTIEDAIMLTDAGLALTDTVFVIGIVDRIGTSAADITKYGNVDVYLTDGELTYEFYRMLNVGGAKFADSAAVSATFAVGDTLIAKGTLTYYAKNDMYELNQKCQLVEVRKLVVPSIANTAENPYTIAEAIELTKAGVALDDTVYVIGVVDHIGTTDANIIKYGNIDVYLKQDTLEYEFYRMLNIGGVKFDSTFIAEPTFVAGDTLIAKGTLTYYASKNMYELNEKCQLVEVRKAAVEPEPEIAQYQLHGSWVENWGGPKLEIAEDKATATATVEMNAGNYGFGIKQIDAAGAQIAWLWTANTEGDTFTREANAFVFVNQKEVSGKNPTLTADVDGVYTFVWKYADNTLTITFPAKPEGIFNTTVDGQAEKFVRDGQLIIRMNGVEYNVLGAKIQ
ncbi:MAG: hypothetical protein SOT07_04035 [Paludibacteraceae bacterium]|nr:hypothetical protein [Paludibacteraceae bacterium]